MIIKLTGCIDGIKPGKPLFINTDYIQTLKRIDRKEDPEKGIDEVHFTTIMLVGLNAHEAVIETPEEILDIIFDIKESKRVAKRMLKEEYRRRRKEEEET